MLIMKSKFWMKFAYGRVEIDPLITENFISVIFGLLSDLKQGIYYWVMRTSMFKINSYDIVVQCKYIFNCRTIRVAFRNSTIGFIGAWETLFEYIPSIYKAVRFIDAIVSLQELFLLLIVQKIAQNIY